MVTAPATGNINYINWVKQQTVVPDFEKKKELPAPKVVVKPTPPPAKPPVVLPELPVASALPPNPILPPLPELPPYPPLPPLPPLQPLPPMEPLPPLGDGDGSNVVKKNAIGADDNTKATADFASMD